MFGGSNKGMHLLLFKTDSFECEKFSVLNSELDFGHDAHGRGRKAESSQVILTSSCGVDKSIVEITTGYFFKALQIMMICHSVNCLVSWFVIWEILPWSLG